ncbi:MAG: phenylalanine--tRNA ligase subunit beta [Crocinitomicaceae bacterium]|nr:phenylalanine--tRNA ligase subunit beta [Crocinitomicaceae bacterium]|tara:strand:+ start:2055 stop:4493 length:2439 start_codon:yes stop_codon:yes gene_type:complete
MKISLNWLKDYININETPQRVGELLTDSGLEVEGLEKIEAVKGGLEGVVIGEVLACEQHPNADKLKVTKVNVGGDEPLQIVCGAPNVAAGQKVVVATVGTTLYPDGENALKIKKGKLRGEVSEGMICAEDELGLGESHAGIMVLDQGVTVGVAAADHFNLEDDYLIEIGLTPNRADAASHIGVARDLIALKKLNPELQLGDTLKRPSIEAFKVNNQELEIDIELKNTEACPRYTGTTIKGVTVKPSPEWLQTKLRAIGIAPINNVVDVTNFVLHEMGQPLHAFDAGKIKGNKVIVQPLAEGTPFVTLDETERKLSDRDLMICNAEEGMCIAGVFGGLKSGVSTATTDIFLESAYFNPVWVRKTAKRHGLNTDASFRYERGTDPYITVEALKRAALLIQEVAGGEVAMEVKDIYPKEIPPFEVTFSYERCNTLIGKAIDKATVKSIITSLDIEIAKESEDTLELVVPPFRVDVQREADVVEEVLRIYGYNNVELPEKMTSSLSYRQHPDPVVMKNRIADQLASLGFYEMMNNSLTASSYYTEGYWNKSNAIRIKNPLSSELDVMRQTLLFDALKTVAYNQNRKSENLRLAEFGKVYAVVDDKREEHENLLVTISGNRRDESWMQPTEKTTFYHLKGAVEAIFQNLGLNQFRLEWNETQHSAFDYGLDIILNKEAVGTLGKVSVDLASKFDVKQAVFAAELNWTTILSWTKRVKVKFQPLPKYPSVRRDLALLLDKHVAFNEIETIAGKQEKKLLKAVNLFDVYEGKNLEEGKKSYAVSFTFQDENKTLTDQQIDKVMTKLVKAYEQELNAALR